MNNQKGFAPVLVLVLVGIALLILAGYSFFGKQNFLKTNSNPSPTPQASVSYSQKQLNMIAHKVEIEKKLNINDAQFEAILLMSADSDFSFSPSK